MAKITDLKQPNPSGVPNPNGLTEQEMLLMLKFCPLCGKPWPRARYACVDKECGAKVRVEPRAHNWWMFYPKVNAWARLKD